METKNIVKWWLFPKATIINKNLPKIQIFPHMKNAKDKHFLTDSVQSIYMLANFKSENTNILSFESEDELYTEIWFYYVKTKEKGNSEKIFKLLSSLIPYPLVVLTDEIEDFTLYTGRFERQPNNFLKLKNIYPSPIYNIDSAESVLADLDLSELPRQNFKVFYDGLRDELAKQLAANQYGVESDGITADKKDQLDILNKQIEALKMQVKKEKQLDRKIDLQMQLKKAKDELKKLLEQ